GVALAEVRSRILLLGLRVRAAQARDVLADGLRNARVALRGRLDCATAEHEGQSDYDHYLSHPHSSLRLASACARAGLAFSRNSVPFTRTQRQERSYLPTFFGSHKQPGSGSTSRHGTIRPRMNPCRPIQARALETDQRFGPPRASIHKTRSPRSPADARPS